jgi:hypothetical protein
MRCSEQVSLDDAFVLIEGHPENQRQIQKRGAVIFELLHRPGFETRQ